MGISHSMKHEQVDAVLTQFEATTSAIQGIEAKVDRMQAYMSYGQGQRKELNRQARAAASMIDNLSGSLNSRCDAVLEYFTNTLDTFACLVERFEISIYDLGLQDAPRQIQREFGPLLMPALVLLVIITVSNCIFGFLLANDAGLAGTFSFGGMNTHQIIKVFALFHIVLIAMAVTYLLIEGSRKLHTPRRGSGDQPDKLGDRVCEEGIEPLDSERVHFRLSKREDVLQRRKSQDSLRSRESIGSIRSRRPELATPSSTTQHEEVAHEFRVQAPNEALEPDGGELRGTASRKPEKPAQQRLQPQVFSSHLEVAQQPLPLFASGGGGEVEAPKIQNSTQAPTSSMLRPLEYGTRQLAETRCSPREDALCGSRPGGTGTGKVLSL